MSVSRKLTAMTPLQVFKLQVSGIFEGLRATDQKYVPPQLGGVLGQRKVIEEETVMTISSFDGGKAE